VALAVGYSIAVILCRRYLPLSRVAAWSSIGLTTAVIVLGTVSLAVPHVGEVITGRLLGQSSSIDLSDVSSGRTNIWSSTFSHMTAEPITLLTGFGWNVYDTRFLYATHNQYLDDWFNLGVVGVGAFLVILYQAVRTARRAAVVATPELRPYMIALVFGIVALLVNLLFTNLTRPWAYVWLYIGLSMKLATEILASSAPDANAPLRASPAGVISHVRAVPRVPASVRSTR
jgi:O-antigen ligase